MDKFLNKGPGKIKGKVSISGSKNASLPILAATLLFEKPVVINNLPRGKDINTRLNLLKSLGSKIILSKEKKTAKILNKKNMKTFASYSLEKTRRGSILVLGPLISKYHKSKTSLPGGSLIGARPVNYHLSALKKLGMKYELKDGYILAKSKGKLTGTTINFPQKRVGATENSIIAAGLAKGKTILKNWATEPENKELTNFLNKAGAKKKGRGRVCKILGGNSLKKTEKSGRAERKEAGTFLGSGNTGKRENGQ
jgi:UDP-N-acetylglucosamine enolpyruvyl transferase